MTRFPFDLFKHFPARFITMKELFRHLPLVEHRHQWLEQYLEALEPIGEGALGQRAAMMRTLLTYAVGGAAIEVFVQQHHGPHRYAQRAFRNHARCWRYRHNA